MSGIILVLVGLQFLAIVATLVWLAVIQNKVSQRDDDVNAAQNELEMLRQQGRNLTMARILMETQDTFGTDIKAAIGQITEEFKRDLNVTLSQVSQKSEADVKQIIAQYADNLTKLRTTAGQEMQHATKHLVDEFGKTLASIKVAAEKPLEQMGSMVEEQRKGFNARVQEELKKHEARLIAQFDAKVSDVVSNYLTETLGNDVDLGAQGPYLFRMLDEHKDDIKQEIVNGV